MPPPLFRYDFLKVALEELDIHHLERLPSGDVRWGDRPLEKPYKGISHITAPLSDAKQGEDRVVFDLWTIESILNKFGKTQGQFVKVYFKDR
jgi:hypothetical protein